MANRVGRISEVATTPQKKGLVPVRPATWWRWVAEERAPQPFKIVPSTTGWGLDQVEQFFAQQLEGLSE